MLIESNLPKSVWWYAILHANYIKNHMHPWSLPDKTPYEMVHSKKLNLWDTYEWGKDVYGKIKQDDKLALWATKVKWIGHSSQSDGHLIYWPSGHKVSVESNIIFDMGDKVKLCPISTAEKQMVSTQKKLNTMSPNVPSIPPIPVCDWLSQPSSKGWIEEIIKPSPSHEIKDLQPSQEPIIGPSEQAQLRRSERTHL